MQVHSSGAAKVLGTPTGDAATAELTWVVHDDAAGHIGPAKRRQSIAQAIEQIRVDGLGQHADPPDSHICYSSACIRLAVLRY